MEVRNHEKPIECLPRFFPSKPSENAGSLPLNRVFYISFPSLGEPESVSPVRNQQTTYCLGAPGTIGFCLIPFIRCGYILRCGWCFSTWWWSNHGPKFRVLKAIEQRRYCSRPLSLAAKTLTSGLTGRGGQLQASEGDSASSDTQKIHKC